MLLLIILMVVGMGWCANTGTLWKHSTTIYGQKTAQSSSTLEFFPFRAYSLKLRLYFRQSIPNTVPPYKYDMFFIGCLFFLTDMMHTLKHIPLFVKSIRHFSAVTSQISQVSFSCTQSV